MSKKIIYIIALTSSIGASVVSVEIAGVQLSVFRGLVILLSMLVLFDLLLNNKPINSFANRDNYLSVSFMIVWALYAFMTLAWVKDYRGWLRSVYFLSLGLLAVLLFTKYLRSKFDVLRAMKAFSVMIYFHNILGWYELRTGNYLFLNNSVRYYTIHKLPVSMFGNTNNFATFMLFSVFILFVCFSNSKNMIYKATNIIFMASSVLLILSTRSRANMLGLVMAAAIFVFLGIKNKRIRRGLLLCLGLAVIFLLIKPEYLMRIYSTMDSNLQFRFTAERGSDITRLNLIKNGLLFLLSTFGFGTGAGNIEIWMANYSQYYVGDIVNIHNWWFEILVGYGVVIFAMYICFYIGLFKSMYRRYRHSTDKVDITISLAIMSCMVGYIIGSVSSSSNISTEWLWVFWAIAIAFQGVPTFEEKKSSTPIDGGTN